MNKWLEKVSRDDVMGQVRTSFLHAARCGQVGMSEFCWSAGHRYQEHVPLAPGITDEVAQLQHAALQVHEDNEGNRVSGNHVFVMGGMAVLPLSIVIDGMEVPVTGRHLNMRIPLEEGRFEDAVVRMLNELRKFGHSVESHEDLLTGMNELTQRKPIFRYRTSWYEKAGMVGTSWEGQTNLNPAVTFDAVAAQEGGWYRHWVQVGRFLLSMLAPSVGLEMGAPCEIVWDKLAEE